MATSDDAKRAVRGLLEAYGKAVMAATLFAHLTTDHDSGFRAPMETARNQVNDAGAALLRATDALIEALAWYGDEANGSDRIELASGQTIESLPRIDEDGTRARHALARVAAMGEGQS